MSKCINVYTCKHIKRKEEHNGNYYDQWCMLHPFNGERG